MPFLEILNTLKTDQFRVSREDPQHRSQAYSGLSGNKFNQCGGMSMTKGTVARIVFCTSSVTRGEDKRKLPTFR
jgi:hypothetical protein